MDSDQGRVRPRTRSGAAVAWLPAGLAIVLLLGHPGPAEGRQIPAEAPGDVPEELPQPVEAESPLPDTIHFPEPGDPAPETLREDPEAEDEDPIVVRNLPLHPEPVTPGWTTGIWEWDREGLQATRALTLLELLEEVPGVVGLRGGDYGQPASVTASGLGAGRVRVFLDGIELPPLEGGIVDLSRVGLAGIDRVRVQRRPGELRIELTPLRLFEPRPYTLLEVATGDLNTNVFRGTFAHPAALGGNVVVSLDRIDTEGTLREEPGASFGAQIRHSLFRTDRTSLAWEFRSMNARRPDGLWSPRNVSRTDLSLHARHEWSPGLLVGAYLQRSSLGTDYGRGVPEPELPEVNEDPRSQAGIRVSLDRSAWWGEVDVRSGRGEGWPSYGLRLSGGASLESLGGASAEIDRQGWSEGGGATNLHARVWTEPRFGLSLFGEVEQGVRGAPFWIPPEEEEDDENGENGDVGEEVEEPDPRFSDRTGFRAGAQFHWNDMELGIAVLRTSADSLRPHDFPPEGVTGVTVGPVRNGFEALASIPLNPVLSGLRASGSLQFWDETTTWRYLPQQTYQGRIHYHNVFLESENLELWTDVGVRGRDAMAIPTLSSTDPSGLARVRSQQSWFARVQVRVVSVRVFVLWENFTVRDRNQDFPDRLQPHTRALYGIRWTLWN
jgi:hypothetical protein